MLMNTCGYNCPHASFLPSRTTVSPPSRKFPAVHKPQRTSPKKASYRLSSASSDRGQVTIPKLKEDVRSTLKSLEGNAALLPGDEPLEEAQKGLSPARSPSTWLQDLSGEWQLVYASNGTVVTRTAAAQLFDRLSSLPGVGLYDIVQRLILSDGVLEADNSAEFGVGLLGVWRISISGTWTPDQQDPQSVQVTFTTSALQLSGFFGFRVPGAGLPKLSIPVPSASAPWKTTYLDTDMRVGRTRSGIFLFFRKGQ
eukprot:jgi/Botrbrau1/18846/Bobra.177_2s0008.2